MAKHSLDISNRFQSTFPAKGTTFRQFSIISLVILFQSTFPAKGTTLHNSVPVAYMGFQSTFPAKGTTLSRLFMGCLDGYFNPRSPQRERLSEGYLVRSSILISIHVPRKGNDCPPESQFPDRIYFNPHSPQRERP